MMVHFVFWVKLWFDHEEVEKIYDGRERKIWSPFLHEGRTMNKSCVAADVDMIDGIDKFN